MTTCDQSRYEYPVVVFDFDGTLADTFGRISSCVDVALTELGLPVADQAVLRSAIGLSLPQIFRKVAGDDAPAASIDQMVSIYRSVFVEISSSKAALFPGMRRQLGRLAGAGVTLAIATSKSRRGVAQLLDAFGITHLFTVVVTDDMVVEKKPHPEMLEHIVTRLGIHPTDAVMVGDAEFDLIMGRAAGLATCAVTWGNHSRERLARQAPDHIVDSPDDLAEVLLAGRAGLLDRP